MDTLRGNFGVPDANDIGDDDEREWDSGEDETGRELPPASIGTDERRMQVRAYNHWASLLADRSFPSIEDLEPAELNDFGPYSVLLDFSTGIEDPAIQYLGQELAQECGTNVQIERLSDIPSRSLLSRITDHYLQILANQAPIGFEAEFVNQREATILYRGILLPYSSDGETIDFIYGVINWKEMADQITSDELLLEIEQALDAEDGEAGDEAGDDGEIYELSAKLEDISRLADNPSEVPDWADGPANTFDDAIADLPDSDEQDDESEDSYPVPDFGIGLSPIGVGEKLDEHDDEDEEDSEGKYAVDYGNSPEEEDVYDDDDAVVARLSSLIQPRSGAGAAIDDEEDEDYDDDETSLGLSELSSDVFAPRSPLLSKKPALPIPGDEQLQPEVAYEEIAEVQAPEVPVAFDPDLSEHAPRETDAGATAMSQSPVEDVSDTPDAAPVEDLAAKPATSPIADDMLPLGTASAAPVGGDGDGGNDSGVIDEGGLYDCLAEARELAQAARSSEDRTRHALYAAVSRAYDVCLAAEDDPDEFGELVAESGLTVQDRAPMTPVVKLVFGVDYDKSRIAEYASVLAHARRLEIERGKLADFLSTAEGGLKGVVQAERRLRKEEAGKAVDPVDAMRPDLAQKLRELDGEGFDTLDADGAEFGVVMIRRLGDGTIVMLGEVSDDIPLIEKVARKLV